MQAEAERAGRVGWRDLAMLLWSPPYRRALAWTAPVVLLAYGFAITNVTLAGDDWFAIFPSETQDSHYALVAGRWLMPVVWAITGGGAFVPYFTFVIGLVLLVLAGLVAAATWGFKRPRAVFSVVTLFVVSPLFTELTLKPGHISFPLAMLCAAGAGWLLLRWRGARLWRLTAATGLLVLALASYQPTALLFVVVVIGAEVVSVSGARRWAWREAWWRWLEILVVAVFSIGVYLLSVRLAWWASGTDPGRALPAYSLGGGYPSSIAELADALSYGLRMTGRFWFGATTLYPVTLKVLSLGLVAAGLATSTWAVVRADHRSWAVGAARAGWMILLGVASAVAPFAVLFLREEPPLRASVFATVGLVVGFWAGLLLEGEVGFWASGRSRLFASSAAAALVLATALGCAFQINKGFFGLYLSNQRDLANANRMLSVMEQMPEFRRGTAVRVALVGQVRFYVLAEPFSNAVPDVPGVSIVDCSGLACQNRLVRMLNLIGAGEREFIRRSIPDDPTIVEAVEAMPGWPEPGSIRFLDGIFVVKGS
jgi:hypothetical protein